MYKLLIDEKAVKDLSRIDKSMQKFILDSLEAFVKNYEDIKRTDKVKALKGNLKGFYRLRLRSFRVIYKEYTDKLIIYVVRIAHRKEIYRQEL